MCILNATFTMLTAQFCNALLLLWFLILFDYVQIWFGTRFPWCHSSGKSLFLRDIIWTRAPICGWLEGWGLGVTITHIGIFRKYLPSRQSYCPSAMPRRLQQCPATRRHHLYVTCYQSYPFYRSLFSIWYPSLRVWCNLFSFSFFLLLMDLTISISLWISVQPDPESEHLALLLILVITIASDSPGKLFYGPSCLRAWRACRNHCLI